MYWNPDPVAFYLPFLHLPIYIYGLCFVTGFILGYFLFMRLLQQRLPLLNKKNIQKLTDSLTWVMVIGTIVGARLGHVLFYDWDRYKDNWLLILNTREGGLASHGGTVGILIALGLFYRFSFHKKTGLKFLELLDLMVIPTALAAFFIRLGNFFNQEIIGTPTSVPWAVVFGNPADHSFPVARHPVQLYEGLTYLLSFALLWFLWSRTQIKEKSGALTGVFFILIFGSRFFFEFLKEVQHSILNQSILQAGQILSIPFILLGGLLIALAYRRSDCCE